MSEKQGLSAQQRDAAALKELLQPVSGLLLTARFFGAASAVTGIAPYIALVQIGTALLDPDTAHQSVEATARFLVMSFVLQLFLYGVGLTISHLADLKLSSMIRDQIVDHIAAAPLSWFSATTSGQIRKAVQDDTRTIHNLVAHHPVDSTVAVIAPLALVGYAFVIDWRLGLLSVSTIPLYVVLQLITMRGMGGKTVEMEDRLGVVSSTIIEFTDGIEVVKTFGRTGESHRRYRRAAEEFVAFYLDWIRPLLRASALSEAVVASSVLLAVNTGAGTLLVRAGYVDVADLMTTTLISLVVPGTVLVLGSSMWASQMAGAAATRIIELLRSPVLPPQGTRVPDGLDIEFREVSYCYPGSGQHDPALSKVSVHLPAGSTTAIVGPSGSGKSTLATMLARFQDPDQGEITLGGVPLPDIADLYDYVSFVLQRPELPAISLRENIRLARPEASDAEIMRAAEQAQIWEDIAALPKGLDSIVDVDVRLSGGQAQRIVIARAILADAPVLVLDEATAATDPESEYQIQRALSALAADRTVVVIAHAPEAVLGVDRVIALDRGRIRRIIDAPTRTQLEELMAPTPLEASTVTGEDHA